MITTKRKIASSASKTIILIAALFLISFIQVQAQSFIKGKIIYEKDGNPASFASVKLIREGKGTISDAAGNFSLNIHRQKEPDTLLITLVGYEDLKMPVSQAVQVPQFKLQQSQKMMESVVVRTFRKEEIAGARSEIVGYFRSWDVDRTGGEIGRSFWFGYKEYQVAKVRFKVYNTYDSCIIRLHIREVDNGEPGRELLKDSVTQLIIKSPIAGNPYEFDLGNYNLVLSQKNIFVSFEVLGATQSDNTIHSLSFVGSEEGKYFYKSSNKDSWHSSDEYTIYMKLLVKYD